MSSETLEHFQCKFPIHIWLIYLTSFLDESSTLRCFTIVKIGRWLIWKHFSLHSVGAVFTSHKSTVRQVLPLMSVPISHANFHCIVYAQRSARPSQVSRLFPVNYHVYVCLTNDTYWKCILLIFCLVRLDLIWLIDLIFYSVFHKSYKIPWIAQKVSNLFPLRSSGRMAELW